MLFFKKLRRLAKHKKLCEEWALANSCESVGPSTSSSAGSCSTTSASTSASASSSRTGPDDADTVPETLFTLKYLGSTLVESPSSEEETAEAIKTVISMGRVTARPGARPVRRPDGAYASVQCRVEYGYCWCVTAQANHYQIYQYAKGGHAVIEQTVAVAEAFVHEGYSGPPGTNDIAMVKLVKPLKLNAYVKPIGLPVKGSNPTRSAILSGWGSISSTAQHSFPQILQTATLDLMDVKACERISKEEGKIIKLYPSQICTSPGTTGLRPCYGDSGGPLIQRNKIVGIISFGPTPCSGRLPNIYTKVSSFVDWIKDIMKHN